MIKRVQRPPTYAEVTIPKELDSLISELTRFHPKVEITLAGGSDLAQGKIVDWFPKRKFFSVKFEKKSERFDHLTELEAGIRAFFKAHLLTTQLVFKTTTVRRHSEDVYHYRIPEQIYKQQQRGALRVPVRSVQLKTSSQDFRVLDLSVGGARLELTEGFKVKSGLILRPEQLKLGRKTLQTPRLQARVTSVTDTSFGVRFSGLEPEHRALIKQALIEGLKDYFSQNQKLTGL